MTGAARGVKRRCTSCESPFYDMSRSPIRCPRCGAEFDPAAATRLVSAPRSPKARTPRPIPAAEAATDPAAGAEPTSTRDGQADATDEEDGGEDDAGDEAEDEAEDER